MPCLCSLCNRKRGPGRACGRRHDPHKSKRDACPGAEALDGDAPPSLCPPLIIVRVGSGRVGSVRVGSWQGIVGDDDGQEVSLLSFGFVWRCPIYPAGGRGGGGAEVLPSVGLWA